MKTTTIKEFDKLICKDGEKASDNSIDKESFDLLEKFILANHSKNSGDAIEIMDIKFSNGQKCLVAQNYVGVISLKNGTNIEILPKIYNANDEKARKIFLKMLMSVRNIKSKNFDKANLRAKKMPIFEVFIKMFLDEVFLIQKTGLKHGYCEIEDNENYLKGKLLIKQQIQKNFIHKEKFYVCYEDFNANQPENRLIKSTLVKLNKLFVSFKTKQLISTLLNVFDEVPESSNIDEDFCNITKDRNNRQYEMALAWSKVFLKDNSFTTFAGKEYANAFLFPMEKLFESYVANKFKQYANNYAITPQERKYTLFTEPSKKFNLEPDIVMRNANDCFIFDTKWKVLKSNLSEVSQADMYQMYAYYNRYKDNGEKLKSVTLLYPYTGKAECTWYCNDVKGIEKDVVNVCFVDLENIDKGDEIKYSAKWILTNVIKNEGKIL